jgi:signal recognition particle receptor subunit beta
MVLINKAINEVTVKLVYYGPGLCGKTTNLEKIYANPKLDNKGKMISMSTETDRTLFFDFMPMELGTIAGQKVRVQLYTVPGQVFYDATRKLVLRGADGVVFVADSQPSMRDSNIDSLENLKTNLRLNRIDPEKVALVFQYNKRDIPGASAVEEMSEYLGVGSAPVVEAQAVKGLGVTATLRAAVSRILDNLKGNVDTTLHDEPALTAPDMKARAGVTTGSAGTPKLSMRSEAGVTEVPAARPSAPPPPPPSREPEPAPFAPAPEPFAVPEPFDDEDDPFAEPAQEARSHEPAVEEPVHEEPFGDVAGVEEHAVPDDLFAEPAVEIENPPSESAMLEQMLANASAMVASLEAALERARENERVLKLKLGR